MRYFLTFLFFILSSNVYATDPDSFPDDPWMKNFFENCGYYPIKHHENNNVFWRFTLEKGDRGGCSSDNIERSGALYWERKEVEGTKLKPNSTYEIEFKVRFVKGFEGERETFFQIHGYNGETCWKPLLMFKFGVIYSRLWISKDIAAISKHTGSKGYQQIRSLGPIDKIIGGWHQIKLVLQTNVGTSKYSLFLNNKLEIPNDDYFLPTCSRPYIKFGIYRPGYPNNSKTSIVDFDDVIVTKVR